MSTNGRICWIALDAVGTLITADPPVAEVYQGVGRKHGSQLTQAEIQRRFREILHSRRTATDLSSSEGAERDFWRTLVAEVLWDAADVESCFAELHEWFAKPYAWRCYEDVAPALQRLGDRGYRLAIASNYDERLHAVRQGMPELARIDTCLVSSEVGWRKPHAAFFAALAEACGCEPGQILMVGDHAEVDIRGAERSGLQAVLLDRKRPVGGNITQNGVMRSLDELPDYLDVTFRPGSTI